MTVQELDEQQEICSKAKSLLACIERCKAELAHLEKYKKKESSFIKKENEYKYPETNTDPKGIPVHTIFIHSFTNLDLQILISTPMGDQVYRKLIDVYESELKANLTKWQIEFKNL